MAKRERSFVQRLCCWATILGVFSIAAVLGWYFAFFAKDVDAVLASCGGCHCLPDEEEDMGCPFNDVVKEFNRDQINTWKSQTAINPFTINCNPFEDGTFCDTDPPLDSELLQLGDTAVCAIHYERAIAADGVTQLCENTAYRLKTYPSRQEAEAAGGYVTHLGHCGVCSTMQDMAVYAEYLQHTSPGNFCRRQSFTSLENGIACYRSLGMTQDCARIWADTSWNTAKNCFGSCVINPTIRDIGFSGGGTGGNDGEDLEPIDYNATGSSPSSNIVTDLDGTPISRNINNTDTVTSGCELDACMRCDRDVSSRLFERYAGRTRTRSGMLGTSAVYCSELASIVQDPCPQTIPLEE
ncbi:hypothetical protein IV203_013867 [Nitzschia inconspicua]|uniref:Uncharacterized protein n=1 Tax=Nitzschia inconspicua TaxID=303405 RepID=A0A9K3Q7S2_9STRA|nr:hypothetical protein IV203_013867 [Nitzschia inconspicua]